jgi:tRNA A-37 threonylcarbamoyl transferase component Bud32
MDGDTGSGRWPEGGPRVTPTEPSAAPDLMGTAIPDTQPVALAKAALAAPKGVPGAPKGAPRAVSDPFTAGAPLEPSGVSIGGLDDDYPTGTILAERYRIVRAIGPGGSSSVYLGEHVSLGRQVAIKIMSRQISRLPELIERLRRETRVASGLRHPNIVEILDLGETRLGDRFLVMEYLAGRTLQRELAQMRCLPLARTIPIVVQICRALHAAHRVGLVHRDLKPENVILTDGDGYADFVTVLDFGLPHLTLRGTGRERALLGSPETMAPEQMTGQAVDRRTDVYALSCIAYAMLCGRPPFVGDEDTLLNMHARNQAPRPSEVAPVRVPPAIEGVLLKGLAKEPDRRWESMAELETALVAAARDAGLEAARPLARPGLQSAPELPPAPGAHAGALPRVTRLLATVTVLLGCLVGGVALDRLAATHGARATAILVINTVPAGARVRLDGREWRPAPVVARDLSPGVHHLEVEGAAAREIALAAGEVQLLELTAAPTAPGSAPPLP